MIDNKQTESLQEPEQQTPNLKLLKLVEELQVHQIELEMQNQQLRSVQSELEHQRFKYLRFYNYFPLPIMNLDKSGIIVSMNMKAEQLIDSSAIINPSGLPMSRQI